MTPSSTRVRNGIAKHGAFHEMDASVVQPGAPSARAPAPRARTQLARFAERVHLRESVRATK